MFTLEDAERLHRESFAPWVQALGMRIAELQPTGMSRLILPASPQVMRIGGTVCGQAVMALADSAMVFAICATLGRFTPMSTVSQTTMFTRAIPEADIEVCARVVKLGRRLCFLEGTVRSVETSEAAAQILSTYMVA